MPFLRLYTRVCYKLYILDKKYAPKMAWKTIGISFEDGGAFSWCQNRYVSRFLKNFSPALNSAITSQGYACSIESPSDVRPSTLLFLPNTCLFHLSIFYLEVDL